MSLDRVSTADSALSSTAYSYFIRWVQRLYACKRRRKAKRCSEGAWSVEAWCVVGARRFGCRVYFSIPALPA